MSDPGTLQSVEAAVRDNKSLKKMTIKPDYNPLPLKHSIQPVSSVLTWTNVAVAILNGAAKNETLRILELGLQAAYPVPELVDEVRRSNSKLRLTVEAGRCESEHVTVGMTVE